MIVWDAVILGVLALYLFQFTGLDAESTLFPRLIGYPVIALALMSLGIQTLPRLAVLRNAETALNRIELPRLGMAVLMTAVYLLLWTPLGFQLDTVVFLTLAPLLLGFRGPVILIAVAVGTAILFAFLFHLGAGAILPSGFLHIRWP